MKRIFLKYFFLSLFESFNEVNKKSILLFEKLSERRSEERRVGKECVP